MRSRMVLVTGAVAMVMLTGACGTGGSRPAGDGSSTSSTPSSATSASTTPAKAPSGTSSKVGANSPPARVATKCDAEHVRAKIRPSDSAAGSRYAYLVLTNTSRTTCTVYGYGGMQLYDGDGGKVPTHVVRDHSTAPATLTVKPGASVRSRLQWSAVPQGRDKQSGSCQPVASVARVTPPDETHNVGTVWSFGPVCDSGRIVQRPYQGTRLTAGG